MNKEKVLGFDVCIDEEEKLIENIFKDYANHEQHFIVNINPEIAVTNYKNEELKTKLNKQKYQIPDGSGIVWAIKKKYKKECQRITGIDLMQKLCEKSQEYSSNIYLYGSAEGIADKAKIELKKSFPNIHIVGTSNGYEYTEDVVKKIEKMPIDILFVGIGSPKQEEFILKYKDRLKNIKILMPVGGSFDVIGKSKKRAPKWMQKYNIEWLYRLFQEPKRIFRQFKLIKFVYLVFKEKTTK